MYDEILQAVIDMAEAAAEETVNALAAVIIDE